MTDKYEDLIMELDRKRDFSGLCNDAATAIKELVAEREALQADLDAVVAESLRADAIINQMRPVVEAAVAWKNAFRLEMQPGDSKLFALFEAVGAFEAKMRETSDE